MFLAPLVAFALCVMLTAMTIKYSLRFGLSEGNEQFTAVQNSHTQPTPRLGGIPIFIALLCYSILISKENDGLSEGLIIASASMFIVGLLEDLGYKISPLMRLSSAILAAIIAIMVFDTSINRLDIIFLDGLISYRPIGIIITIFAVTGLTQAFNLVDGVNGLAGFVTLNALCGLYYISSSAGLPLIADFCGVFGAIIIGFLVFNFPKGLIFLGDSGAYLLGFIIAWMIIITITSSNEVSPWAMLLIVFWPIADTLLAIWRRSNFSKPAFQPDRMHFHQLVMRTIEIHYFKRKNRKYANPLTTVVISPFVTAPVLAGSVCWNNNALSFAFFLATVALFLLSYYLIGRIACHLPKNRSAGMSKKTTTA